MTAEDQEELEELRKLFDLRHEADQRAVKRWQEMNPQRANVWPDRGDLVLWLLKRVERSEAISWALTQAAGGEIRVDLNALQEFKEGKSVLTMITRPEDKFITFTTMEVANAGQAGR